MNTDKSPAEVTNDLEEKKISKEKKQNDKTISEIDGSSRVKRYRGRLCK